MKTILTDYYKNEATELLEKKFGNNLHIAIRVEDIDRLNKIATLKIGLHDGNDFISVFGNLSLYEGELVILEDTEGLIKTNFKDWIHLI